MTEWTPITQPAAPTSVAETIRTEFNTALKLALMRAQSFRETFEHLDNLLEYTLRANFYTWSSEQDVLDFYSKLMHQFPERQFEVMDFLFELNALFAGGLALHGLDVDIDKILSRTFGANAYGELTKLIDAGEPAAVLQRPFITNATQAQYRDWLEVYPWLRALLSIRLFAIDRIVLSAADQRTKAKPGA